MRSRNEQLERRAISTAGQTASDLATAWANAGFRHAYREHPKADDTGAMAPCVFATMSMSAMTANSASSGSGLRLQVERGWVLW